MLLRFGEDTNVDIGPNDCDWEDYKVDYGSCDVDLGILCMGWTKGMTMKVGALGLGNE